MLKVLVAAVQFTIFNEGVPVLKVTAEAFRSCVSPLGFLEDPLRGVGSVVLPSKTIVFLLSVFEAY